MKKITDLTRKYRIAVSRIFMTLIVVLLLFSSYSWQRGLFINYVIDFIGFILVLICTFGRLWALTYISGHKTKNLITEGPYSMVRNPLYLFSFIGAVGIGLVSKNMLVLTLMVIMFLVYYTVVIRAEEEHLNNVHGEDFENYLEKTPRIIPKFSLFHEPVEYMVNARKVRISFFSVVWFPIIFMILLIIEHLHDTKILPILFSLP